MKQLKDFTDARYKSFDEALKNWRELKEFIKPLLTEKELILVSKIDMHFTMLPIEDLMFIGIMSAPMLAMPKMFCLKCGKEIEKEEV